MTEDRIVDVPARWIVLKPHARAFLAPFFPTMATQTGPILISELQAKLTESPLGLTVSARIGVRDRRTGEHSQKEVQLTVPWDLVAYYFDITLPMPESQVPPAPASPPYNPIGFRFPADPGPVEVTLPQDTEPSSPVP